MAIHSFAEYGGASFARVAGAVQAHVPGVDIALVRVPQLASECAVSAKFPRSHPSAIARRRVVAPTRLQKVC